eukprot:403336170
MEWIKSFFFKKDIIAKFVVNGPINQKTSQKLMNDIAKASKQKNNIVAIAVAVNSPGGSAVQSSISGDKIKAFSKRKDLPLFTFGENLAASGGYWILCVGDTVYANKNSIVGSIGVIAMLPNFKQLFDQTRIKRTTISTSEQLLERRFDVLKDQSEQTEEDRQFILDNMDDCFQNFKSHVLQYRQKQIKEENYEKVFNADVFTGDEAKSFGLIDEFGDLEQTMTEKYPKVDIVNFSKESQLDALKKRFQLGGVQIGLKDLLKGMKDAKSI